MKDDIKHIAFFWSGSFPYGFAYTNRILAYAKGLVEQAVSVIVICFAPTFENQLTSDHKTKGVYQGVEYIYTSGNSSISSNRFRRMFYNIAGFTGGLRKLLKLRNQNRLDVVFIPAMRIWYMAVFLVFARLHGIKVVHERAEYPFLNTQGHPFLKLEVNVYLRYLCKFCDGIVLISGALEKTFRAYVGKRAKILLVPAIVDVLRFEQCHKAEAPPIDSQYIAWCGSIWGKKDGVPQLIEAFRRIAKNHPRTKLILIAPKNGTYDFIRVQEMIRKSECADRIVLTGKVSQSDMPRYLGNADVLALTRPSSLQAEFGFPTKLPEYLSTSRPVLVTTVGDIPRYLTDGKNAYLVEPDDIDGLAAKLDYILDNPAEAKKIGKNGKDLAKNVFSYSVHAKRLILFLREL